MKKLKLTTLSEAILKDKETKAVLGGNFSCSCSCAWRNNTGSTAYDNTSANYDRGIRSEHGCNQYMKWENEDGQVIFGTFPDAHE